MSKQPVVVVNDQKLKTVERAGKSDLFYQDALFERGDGAVFPCEISLGTKPNAKPSGRYALAASSYVPGKYGSIELRIDLEAPIQAVAVKTA
jgi:hypothetical protein